MTGPRSTAFRLAAGLLALFPLLACGAAQGQGILYPRDGVSTQPFYVKSVRVSSNIVDSLAETTVEQTFVNSSSTEQEGTYVFPLPEGATVTSFSLKAGERVIEGRLLSSTEARSIYESIVRRRKDPALLEYMGRGLFRASVFPIPANGERLLTLKYAEILKPQGATRRFAYPLSTGRFSIRPISVSSVSVKVRTSSPLKTVYSPTHDVSVRRLDDTTATASWEGHGEFPDRDFQLFYASTADDVGLSLLTYQSMDKDGYFVLVAAPRFTVPKDRILSKQIVFVLDRTGSMQANKKMEQGKAALKFCLDNLNPNDRFDVITFNESADVLTKTLVPASRENVDRAQKFVRDVDASGGTNIDEALRSALGLLKNAEGTQKMVVFITDGLPTVGETNVEKILSDVKRLNNSGQIASTSNRILAEAAAAKARIFSFGVGYDVNVPFLDRLSDQNRGEADYVRPEEYIENVVSAFYAKISSPVLSNLKLNFEGAETYDVYPKELPDLFKGGQMVVTGRFRGSPSGAVRLTGVAQDQQASFKLDKAFGENSSRSGMAPRIWATRKIGYLLDAVRLNSNQEVIDEIIRLSKEHGIITPYTSYLADERQDMAVQPLPEIMRRSTTLNYQLDERVLQSGARDAERELTELGTLSRRGDVGKDATSRAQNSQGYKSAGRAPAGAQGGFGAGGFGGGLAGMSGGGRGGQSGGSFGGARAREDKNGLSVDFADAKDVLKLNAKKLENQNKPGYQQISDAARVQNVAGRTFYRRSNIWFDNDYASGQKVVKVQALSDAHFALLNAVKDLNRYAGVGDEVVINIGKVAVQIGKEGKEKLTDAEIRELTGK